MESKGISCISHSHKLSMKTIAHLLSVLNVVTVLGFVLFSNTPILRAILKKDRVSVAAVRKRSEDSHMTVAPCPVILNTD